MLLKSITSWMSFVLKYRKAYKYLLLPNKEQEQKIIQTFGCCRKVWNELLNLSKQYYEEHKLHKIFLPKRIKDDCPYLYEVDSLALCNVQINLHKAYKAFFKKIVRFPKFKSKKDTRQSYTTNNQRNLIRIDNGKIKLPKIGMVKIISHREIKENEKIKSCTISKSPSGKYYISVLVEGYSEIVQIVAKPENIIGLDFMMNGLFVTNQGERANYPRYYRKLEEKLVKLSRKVSQKKKGSSNRNKARIKLATFHEYISNSRNDFLHKKSKELADKHDAIAIETLNMQNMGQSLRLGKSVADNGWGKFVGHLKYKLQIQGKQLLQVATNYPSSKLCSECGAKDTELTLSDRVYNCKNCHLTIDRDLNASINIRIAGIARIA